jgi:hypothetical protein
MDHLLIGIGNLALRLLRHRPSINHQLARKDAMVDRRLYAKP